MALPPSIANREMDKFHDNGDSTTSVMVTGPAGAPLSVTNTLNTYASVAGSATSVTLLAANANRVGWSLYNDSSANLYVQYGTGAITAASTTSFFEKIPPSGSWECPANMVSTAIVYGIWDSATGAVKLLEATAL